MISFPSKKILLFYTDFHCALFYFSSGKFVKNVICSVASDMLLLFTKHNQSLLNFVRVIIHSINPVDLEKQKAMNLEFSLLNPCLLCYQQVALRFFLSHSSESLTNLAALI